MSAPPASSAPEAPRLKASNLLPLDDDVAPAASSSAAAPAPLIDTTNPDYANLTHAQLYELNSGLLQDAVPDRALIGALEPMDALRAEYENGSAAFVRQIDFLVKSGFAGVRRSRGDGNCFYRSLAFAYVERLLYAPDDELAVGSALSTLEGSLALLDAAGFQKMVYEDFYEPLAELVRSVIAPDQNGATLSPPALLEAFQSAEVSNSVVVFLRLLASAQIRADPDTFEPFLFHPETGDPLPIRTFCEGFVEAADREADHVQITALARALHAHVRVAYLDGHAADGRVEFVDFESEGDILGLPSITLLYRPGHYDILHVEPASGRGIGH